jgi:ribosomal protein S12 methylthiotransferase accessory factor
MTKRATRIQMCSTPKYGDSGVHRSVPAEQTWERVRPLLGRIGITRLADITGLDRIGIPTYSAVRPTDKRAGVAVTCGKGTRPIEAKVGAVMESIEYKVGEPDEVRGTIARFEELEGAVVHPSEFHLPPWVKAVEQLRLEWVEGWDLVQDEPVWLPAASAFALQPRGDFLFDADTNGIASGNCLEEAVCHALAELIERDADSIAQSHLAAHPASQRYPLIDLETLPESSRALVNRFVENDVEVYIRNVTSDIGVACCRVTCVERSSQRLLLHGGCGAHLVAEVALNRALTEAAQSRAADIQGSREDLVHWRRVDGDAPHPSVSDWRMPEPDRRLSFAEVPSQRTDDVLKDIRLLIGRLQAHGFKRIAVVDFTATELAIPVIRVIVPGLEIACVDPWRTGPRLAAGAGQYIEERWST